mgnify:CR=1 FL=1
MKILKKLRNDKKNYITSLGIVMIILIISGILAKLGFAMATPETTELLKEQQVENFTFKNTSLTEKKLMVDVLNTDDSNSNISTIDVTYLDREGKEITTVSSYIGNTIKPHESKKLVVTTDEDLSNVYSIKYTINR